uniref:Uncharacterized protein isoform X1 n=1 Tax=Nicotiana tabacum TaxID=4097 RepID=A0A1S3XDQ6_TOBAC|nr:PREDICTED: uncharacterized protein LOC107763969 isoform X1 [Nicotiana tabacum]XP_016437966.1 PREDICTED: uncharacterized protein LOC107763969 isoform X1 [Nicotiana tabacum]XP_016437967.1 PREDICTED: uncharacterized protein LOC107763969 isoform X1 [Nicotiana tabacum]XP_016437968.1 PREDICTED: uncharacterized protein LOC107763969 isoform X1 [Nicotiana tabacum]XP_016437969.1 PREDICTED: uncharacterized protein LOC107763969 isoform X1 [Nicotiana tabacum]
MDMKGISWVGNIYHKFEAMCLEMEEVMYQDTVRYVENQVQTVGASVKRFYSDVMLDMHPHCNIDPVKVAATDLSLNPYAHTEIKKKLKANLKGLNPRGITKKLIDDTQVIKGKSKNGGVYRRQNVGIKEIVRDSHSPSKKSDAICLVSRDAIKFSSVSKVRGDFEVASDCMTMTSPSASVKGHDSVEATKEVYNHIMDTNVPAAGISSNAAASDMSLSVESVGKSQPDLRNTAVICDLQSDSHADRHTDKELAGETGSEISSNTHNAEVAREELNKSHGERTDRYCSNTLEKYDLNESDVEIVEQFDESNLGGTCVLVDGGRLHIPQGSVKRKSYKKKLREVFSTKKKATRKEYEELGALHGDQLPNLEDEDKVMQVHAANANTKKLSANDHSESEWEIL